MTLDLRVHVLPEPALEFGGTPTYTDPKTGLAKDGPFSARFAGGQPGHVRLGLVGPSEMTDAASQWFARCQHEILSQKSNRRRFPDYPGFADVFRTPLELADRWVVEIPDVELTRALMLPEQERFGAVIQLYANGMASLAQREMGPNVVVCSLSYAVVRTCGTLVRNATGYRRRRQVPKDAQEYQLVLPLEADDEQAQEDEALLYRTFRRALKARVMTMRERLPIQIAHNHLFEDGPDKDDPATRAWSVSVGLYYKAGGIPWRLADMQAHVCFVGVSFHRLKTTKREALYASMAQAFSTDIEGFVLRGERIPWREDRQPYLTAQQAERLGTEVLAQYRERAGRPPVRITLHKTTRFAPEEREGFMAAFRDMPMVEMLTLRPSDFRLLSTGDYPPSRGTLCSINGTAHMLYTTGVFEVWGTYPGPHVPQPFEIITDAKDVDIRRISEETLGLTKMNWNSASIGSRSPITLHMAQEVGPIMVEVPEQEQPELSYRYYM